MAKIKLNISLDENVLKDIDRLVIEEQRPSRSNAIEVLVKRGFKLPLAAATLDFANANLEK